MNANGSPSPDGNVIGADRPLVGNTATSDSTNNTTASGKYCWRARYLGDANYNATNHTNATDECFTVQAECHVTVDKTCSVGGGPDIQDCVVPVDGALVTYKYAVSNTGTTDITSGTITDMLGAPYWVPQLSFPTSLREPPSNPRNGGRGLRGSR